MVLGVLEEEGFAYDPVKDSDLEDIPASYLEDGGAFFIALESGELAGTAAVRRTGSDACEIRRVYVRKDLRGRGIGSALFRSALSCAEGRYGKITLKTDTSLHIAIGMYLGYGFTIVREEGTTLHLEKTLS
ncbi:GNAT family N-acetyltransferase [Methanolobus chelungpuianus]|uniref:GNAT family N-acetyltransferase n=1 Tax=Methanolobus chelungpuianus TaxID=502115 RepID=UPI002113E704|nr:GNAT family N-acetyltransferase [Methanolobus chelungpuianus]